MGVLCFCSIWMALESVPSSTARAAGGVQHAPHAPDRMGEPWDKPLRVWLNHGHGADLDARGPEAEYEAGLGYAERVQEDVGEADRARKAPPITDELLRAMVATCGLRTTAGRRDRCMLLLGRGPSTAGSSSPICPSPTSRSTTTRSSTRSRLYGTGSPPSTTSASAKARSSGPSQRSAATTLPGKPSTSGSEAVPTRPAPGTGNRSLPTGPAVRSTGHRGSRRGPDEAGPVKTRLGGREAGVSGPRAVPSGESLAQGAGQAAREADVTLRTLPWMPSPSPHSPGRPFKE